MNDKTYYVVAVIIALAVPMIFGSMYFFKYKNITDNTNYVTMLDDKLDLVMSGDTYVETGNEGEQSVDFAVHYFRGTSESVSYKLYLDNLSGIESSILYWKLSVYDEAMKSYIPYEEGSINKKDVKKVVLKPHMNIKLSEIQKLRFTFFIDDNNSDFEQLKFNIMLEQE